MFFHPSKLTFLSRRMVLAVGCFLIAALPSVAEEKPLFASGEKQTALIELLTGRAAAMPPAFSCVTAGFNFNQEPDRVTSPELGWRRRPRR